MNCLELGDINEKLEDTENKIKSIEEESSEFAKKVLNFY